MPAARPLLGLPAAGFLLLVLSISYLVEWLPRQRTVLPAFVVVPQNGLSVPSIAMATKWMLVLLPLVSLLEVLLAFVVTPFALLWAQITQVRGVDRPREVVTSLLVLLRGGTLLMMMTPWWHLVVVALGVFPPMPAAAAVPGFAVRAVRLLEVLKVLVEVGEMHLICVFWPAFAMAKMRILALLVSPILLVLVAILGAPFTLRRVEISQMRYYSRAWAVVTSLLALLRFRAKQLLLEPVSFTVTAIVVAVVVKSCY